MTLKRMQDAIPRGIVDYDYDACICILMNTNYSFVCLFFFIQHNVHGSLFTFYKPLNSYISGPNVFTTKCSTYNGRTCGTFDWKCLATIFAWSCKNCQNILAAFYNCVCLSFMLYSFQMWTSRCSKFSYSLESVFGSVAHT